jgi:hypothetical protein
LVKEVEKYQEAKEKYERLTRRVQYLHDKLITDEHPNDADNREYGDAEAAPNAAKQDFDLEQEKLDKAIAAFNAAYSEFMNALYAATMR